MEEGVQRAVQLFAFFLSESTDRRSQGNNYNASDGKVFADQLALRHAQCGEKAKAICFYAGRTHLFSTSLLDAQVV
jgi:hypothetical protein